MNSIRSTHRRLTLFDLMVLVAAAALGMAGSRNIQPGAYGGPWKYYIKVKLTLYLAAATFGLLFLALRQPRPRLRRLMMRPGVMACASADIALIGMAAATVAEFSTEMGWPRAMPELLFRWAWQSHGAPSWAIAAAWITLALNRRFRPEPSWLDRAGRFVAVGWLTVYLQYLAFPV
jgi:hypothetical protein